MINLEYGHRCRADPVEAAVYSLQSKGVTVEKFRANASTEVTVELEKTTEQEKQHGYSSMELPVDFSKEDVAKVRFDNFAPFDPVICTFYLCSNCEAQNK